MIVVVYEISLSYIASIVMIDYEIGKLDHRTVQDYSVKGTIPTGVYSEFIVGRLDGNLNSFKEGLKDAI